MLTFTQKVLNVVRKIPVGKTMTYGEVARRAGSPRGARAVGTIMKNNLLPDVPCHRVVPTTSSTTRDRSHINTPLATRDRSHINTPLATRGRALSIKTVGQYNRGGPAAKLKILLAEKAK